MAECKDCIHFCVCSPYTAPNESYPEVDGCKCFRATADVVPMSEVDEIAEELSDTIVMKDELFDEVVKLRGELANAKADVARDIFEEIEAEITAALKNNYARRNECNAETDLSHTANISGKIACLRRLADFVDELKKKYTGEKECPKCKHFVGCEQANWERCCEEYKEEQK